LRAHKGFTAIELLVTIVIAGILTSIAVASLGPLLEDRRMREAAQQVEQTIRKAQQLARTKDQTTYVQFNNPGATSKTFTLLAGKPCSAVPPTFSNTDNLGQNMQILGTTLDYGNCPDGTSRLNIIAFDNRGNLTNADGAASSVGQCIGINDSVQNSNSGYVVCIMTASGDITSFKVDNVLTGAPAS
jgi:prepilin-type N-terminal cleavage/methylation domain-containing protein